MRHALAPFMLAIVAFGCGNVDPPQPVVLYPAPYPSPVEVRPETRVVVAEPPPRESEPEREVAVRADILVTTARKLDRPTEVIGVIDEHEPSGRQDAAFALLRRRAAAMGADAVIGVEFHHGEESGEPTHLSGLAVRYLDRLR